MSVGIQIFFVQNYFVFIGNNCLSYIGLLEDHLELYHTERRKRTKTEEQVVT